MPAMHGTVGKSSARVPAPGQETQPDGALRPYDLLARQPACQSCGARNEFAEWRWRLSRLASRATMVSRSYASHGAPPVT